MVPGWTRAHVLEEVLEAEEPTITDPNAAPSVSGISLCIRIRAALLYLRPDCVFRQIGPAQGPPSTRLSEVPAGGPLKSIVSCSAFFAGGLLSSSMSGTNVVPSCCALT